LLHAGSESKADMLVPLEFAEIGARCHSYAEVFEQSMAEVLAVVAEGADAGVDIERSLRRHRHGKAHVSESIEQIAATLREGGASLLAYFQNVIVEGPQGGMLRHGGGGNEQVLGQD